MPAKDQLKLSGVSQNNLKGFDLTIDHNKLVVITGISGSGKSTLAFDTIYAEGQRRYIETFSPYTRQFLERLPAPQLDTVSGVRPTLALQQQTRITNSRSTVGTVTELNDFLKIIFASISELHCPSCGLVVEHDTVARVLRKVSQDITRVDIRFLLICFPITLRQTATMSSLCATLREEGFVRFYDKKTNSIHPLEELDGEVGASNREQLFVIVDRIKLPGPQVFSPELKERLSSSIQQGYRYGLNRLTVHCADEQLQPLFELSFSKDLFCNRCERAYSQAKPSLFSFNSPLGACPACKGFGRILLLDRNKCIPNPALSIDDGALACFSTPATRHEFRALHKFCAERKIDTSAPWKSLSPEQIESIFAGAKKKGFRGVQRWFNRLQRKIYKMHVRVMLSRYRSEFLCPDCNGTRLREEALRYRVCDRSITDIWNTPVEQLLPFFESIAADFSDDTSVSFAIQEVQSRLGFLLDVGLGYLTLERQSRTLSGGESQRVNLTAILGSELVNTTLVLDEPSIGLHSRDTDKLLRVLTDLRDCGNSVLVVEHDPEVILAADEVIDLGPGAAASGGEIVFQGPVSALEKNSESVTSRYLFRPPTLPAIPPTASKAALTIQGARAHNLRSVDVTIPLNQFVVISGVSGSGKSSLVKDCLFEMYRRQKDGSDIARLSTATVSSIHGAEQLSDIVLIDQSPVGRTPRSNPATYTKAWEIFRGCLADTDQARKLGLNKAAFSFNVDGGRCPECKGAGYHRIEMQFLADVFVQCEQCLGKRFQPQVLEVTFEGKNVIELLEMSLDESIAFIAKLGARKEELERCLKPLLDLGLGYLRLGQPLSTLSGGEAQRLKLAKYLAESTNTPHLFILDEPTTGLHLYDIHHLLTTLRHMIARGHSILCIEHNLDVISQADWLIDLGPEGGNHGGEVLVAGAPCELLKDSAAVKNSFTLQMLEIRREKRRARKQATRLAVRSLPSTQTSSGSQPPITISGARHHNLKDITVSIPKNTFTVITGVSGSGKSTLAFDILFSEGQRRYIDCLSPYARQYITQFQKPDLDSISSIPPTIAVSQKTAPPLGVSTIATTTELYQYLRLLYAKVGTQHCPEHDIEITGLTSESMTEEILSRFGDRRLFLFAPAVSGRKGYYQDLFQRALRADINEARVDGKVVSLNSELRLERHKLHWVSLLVASIAKPQQNMALLKTAIEQCLLLGSGVVEVVIGTKHGEPAMFSTERVCPVCKRGFRQLDPQDFSFRSKRGVCEQCAGYGYLQQGRSAERVTCPACSGARIGPVGRHVYLQKKGIAELCQMTAPQLLAFFNNLGFDRRLSPLLEPVLREIRHRLEVIIAVGLDYLHLHRDASTLSGGEAQRLRLSRTLGSPLSGICYVLDEPTIGLHAQDHRKLLDTLYRLRDSGNTVVVVEHDEETIVAADHIIDIGPGGGPDGGNVVAVGSVSDIMNCPQSVTGQALKQHSQNGSPLKSRRVAEAEQYIELFGASAHTLKNVTARFPIGKLTVVAGVSGAGKSSLVRESLIPAFTNALEHGTAPRNPTWKELRNWDSFERCIEIDQSPVGKTSASIPASYLGVFDDVRKLFSLLPEAQARGFSPSHFSFNVAGGRCEACRGKGALKVPMSFLPEAITVCEECNGARYDDSTLEITFQGYSLSDILKMTISRARDVFAHHHRIRRALDYMHHLGVGYLTLGQPTYTLSGGELQRLKIAREFGSREAVQTLYILDEPTTGLHMIDIEKLLAVLRELIAKGNTVIVIEHNLDFITAADYVVELGPGPGEHGGEIIFSGKPELLVKARKPTPTGKALQERHLQFLPQELSAEDAKKVGNRP